MIVQGDAICGSCGCRCFRNQHPHYVELGYTGRIVCCPCYSKSRKAGVATSKKALRLKAEYARFLKNRRVQPELFA